MSEEDDWFERALRDLDDESDRSADGEAADGEDSEAADDDRFVDGDFGEDHVGDPEPSGGDEDAGGPFGGGGDGDPFGGSGGGGGDPFGGSGGGGGDPFGGGSFGDDDPFGGYRNSAPRGSDDFGFGEFVGEDRGGGETTDFDVDPDELDSSIERTNVGIAGLDEMILGGVPRSSLLSVIGGAGTGKTTFALQFLNEALESGGKGVYITLEQTSDSIFATAEEKGWSFREHADADRLAVVDVDPIEMANSLASIRNDLTRLIAEFDADRLVLDSVSLLEMMYDHPAKRRSEVFGFTRSLKSAGVTTLLTSEASEENPYASRHGIVEYLTDAVFVLQYVRGSDFRETRLAVEIQKIRDANHSRETKPYEITDTGISVYGQANIF
ncbi:KaiC domain-containing protein [Halorubrum sp. AD140]|uniref:KaiC domain-containing protein n=1 Tax=Halorubrum sp. AD140 TaxID=3050073 RepID=UPI002ACCCBF7|nr:KaiC domain-containing protein [Halorubrum sp. AD140]MDZ5809805.1 KaiC domain-containing protein [Halorubrum sp. AD140]